MPTRTYVSPARTAAADEKRARVLAAATALLRKEASIAGVSMDAVAKAADVTRLTVYNQFQSRRGLLEAVFERIASEGGLGRIPEAMAKTNPAAALERLIEIFCDFWSHDEAIGRLSEAAASDPEFAQAIGERVERRRKSLSVLLERAIPRGVSAKNRRDAVDLIFALTSYPVFAMLSDGRTPEMVCTIIKASARAALDHAATKA